MNENENLNNNTTDDVCDSIPEGAKDVNLNEEKFSFSSLPDPSTGTAIASLVLGIFSVLCCCTNIPALIMAVAGAVLGLYSYKKDPLSRTISILRRSCSFYYCMPWSWCCKPYRCFWCTPILLK